MYRQTCIKRLPLGQRKSGLLRQVTSYEMEFSMTGQEKVGLLIQVTVYWQMHAVQFMSTAPPNSPCFSFLK
jgi:hypothetical protein